MAFEGSTSKKKASWTQRCAIAVIKFLGWKIKNTTAPTACKKAVLVLAPHTSNWDFFYGVLFKLSHPHLKIRFAIKKEVMFFPLSFLMKKLGAIPIDRKQASKRTGVLAAMIAMFNQTNTLLLIIAPEGTRSHVTRWKTGFYRLAQAADVPVILTYINYSTREMGLGPIFDITGNMQQDIATIQDFYRKIPGKYPEKGII